MTDTVESLNKQIDQLTMQLTQQQQQTRAANAQLEAHKGFCNEQLQSALNLRTSIVIFQQDMQAANKTIAEKQKAIDGLDKQLSDATAQIATMSVPSTPAEQPAE